MFNACNKDAEISDPAISIRNDAKSAILSKINFDQNGNILLGSGSNQILLQHAPIEKQREVSESIFNNISLSRIDSMRELYGYPVWELATIDISYDNSPNYAVFIPLFKGNSLTSIIMYGKQDNKISSSLFTSGQFNTILNTNEINSIFCSKWIVPVSKFQVYQYLLNAKIDERYQRFTSYLNNSQYVNSNSINLRTVSPCDDGEVTIITVTYDPDTYTETIKIDCWGGGGFDPGSDWYTGGDFGISGNGGTTSNNNGTDNSGPKIDKGKKLKCAVEVADFMAQAEVLELIANNNLTDPCDPTKSAADLLEKALNGYCYAKIGDEPLNLKDAEHFLGELFEGSDYIRTDNSLAAECPLVNCIWNQMKNGVLGTGYVCEKLESFASSTENNGAGSFLYVFADNRNLSGALAAVSTAPNGIIYLQINPDYCDNSADKLNIFETLQHELVHAEIYSKLFKKYGYLGDANSLNYAEAFHQLVLKEYGDQAGPDQHHLMLEQFLDEMINSLIEIAGEGTFEDFEGLVLNGFPEDVLNYCGITKEEVLQKVNRYIDFKKKIQIFFIYLINFAHEKEIVFSYLVFYFELEFYL